MSMSPEVVQQVREAVNIDRLLDTAVKLIEIPSPTRSAGKVADFLAQLLTDEGFQVERLDAGWSDAPAVIARMDSGAPGKTLQFNGHQDTVHLPFVPPRIEDGKLYGSSASDMKGGFAAAVEAARAVRDTGLLKSGSLLLTAHDMHEKPWGDGKQVDELIRAGVIGDAVMLPEYFCSALPVIGRGMTIVDITITRDGEPMHEMMGGREQPNVIVAGSKLVSRFAELDEELAKITHPLAGRENIFQGMMHSGEIFNQSPTRMEIKGTRRWLPQTTFEFVQQQILDIAAEVAEATNTHIDVKFQIARDAYQIDENEDIVKAFQSAHEGATGQQLPLGAKPFVDDGNTFVRLGGIPAITHGPDAKGAHTVNEEVPINELERIANVYALTALAFC